MNQRLPELLSLRWDISLEVVELPPRYDVLDGPPRDYTKMQCEEGLTSRRHLRIGDLELSINQQLCSRTYQRRRAAPLTKNSISN